MPTERLFYASQAIAGEAVVTGVESGGENAKVWLNATIFHPLGGGQRADEGRIGDAQVLHVWDDGDDIVHVVDCVRDLKIGDRVQLEVEEDARRLHERLHSAGHLLAAVTKDLIPHANTVCKHHWPKEAYMVFAVGESVPQDSLKRRLEEALLEQIEQALPIHATGDESTTRAITITGYSAVLCRGTHVQATDALVRVSVRSIDQGSGVLCVGYDVPLVTPSREPWYA